MQDHFKEGYIMSVLDNWDKWKDFLANRLNQAEKTGVNQKIITEIAEEIGGYLATKVEPRNDHEKVLADLWSVADEEEQHAIANMMVKLVQPLIVMMVILSGLLVNLVVL